MSEDAQEAEDRMDDEADRDDEADERKWAGCDCEEYPGQHAGSCY